METPQNVAVVLFESTGYRLAIQRGGTGHIQQPQGGGRRIIRGDRRGYGKALPHAFAPGNPGDVHVLGTFRSMALSVTTMVGADNDHALIRDARLANRLQDDVEIGVGLGERLELFCRTPAVLVPGDIRVSEMDEA